MLSDSQLGEDRLFSVCAAMRGWVESSIREGMLRAMPDPVEARQIADLYARMLHRIRAMEIAMGEFQADLRRAHSLFENAERRANGAPRLVVEDMGEREVAVG